ncbi:MAG: hypothetical protein LQ344_006582 [Seirophora lacunosa]|nr:MAG: hypothetical protein LQ344_006582 [Seirophora lacunosa]
MIVPISDGKNRGCASSSSPRRLKWIVPLVIISLFALIAWSLDRSHHAVWTTVDDVGAGGRGPNKHRPADKEEYVAICMAVRNQHRELPELLQHHYHHLGIRRFYIMDDNSLPPLSTRTYGIPSSAITFQYFYFADHEQEMQYHIYNHCNEHYGSRHTWIGYLDADEYLEMTGNETLVDFLHTFDRNTTDQKPIGAVGVQWRTHTSSGLEKRPPDGGCRKAFTECIIDDPTQDNRHIKSFVKTAYYAKPETPHFFALKAGAVTVGEHGDVRHDSWRTPITRDRVALHHYGVKSKEQYMEKVQRGNAMDQPKSMQWWDHIRDMNHTACPELALYEP